MRFTSPAARRSVIALLAAGLAAATLPAATATAGALAEGHDAAPVVVAVSDASAAHWMPYSRRRRTLATRTRTVPTATAPLSPAPTVQAAPVVPALPVAPTLAANAAPEHASSYSFMAQDTSGGPIRWDACAAVHWVFNPAGAPAGGLAAVQSAVARVSTATGLQFVYDGTSASVPTGSYLDSQTASTGFRPLLVGWSTPSQSSLLANQPANLVGMDQAIWARPATGATHIVSGVVALNSDINAGTTGGNSWYTFALHELGHAVGLGHTTDATQIMSPTIPAAATDYGSGDLAGLAKVGGTC